MLDRAVLIAGLFALSLAPSASYATDCTGKTGTSGRYWHGIDSGGMQRNYLLDVPLTYIPDEGTPLIFNFHGFGSSAFQQAFITDIPQKAGAQGYIVIHPNGYERSWNAGECCGKALAEDIDDVGFVLDILEEVKQAYCIDDSRIFTMGWSNGGYMTHRLACEASDVFASAAPYAGLVGIPCAPLRPVPIHQGHGTDDGLVPYEDGVEDVALWAELNGCLPSPVSYFKNPRAECVRYEGCDDGADVELCTINGGTHWWPPGPAYSQTDATLEFFLDHPMP